MLNFEHRRTALMGIWSMVIPAAVIIFAGSGGWLRLLPATFLVTSAAVATLLLVPEQHETKNEAHHQERDSIPFTNPEPWTPRELEILALIAQGCTNDEIAASLVVTLSTVKTHINNLYRKLGVRNRVQAVARAQALELV